jgi:single-strand DNA-binding protein
MSTQVTLRGRLTRDPELRYSAAGKPVVKFAVVTSRNFKDQDGAWQEKDTTFWDVVAFGQLAEGCAESLEKGTAVIVQGNAAQEEWTTREGEKRRSMKVTADDVAASLRWASAKVAKSDRSTGYGNASSGGSGGGQGDPWATGGTGGSNTPEDPPF